MARLTVTVTVLLCTFALSVAFSKPENENQTPLSAEPHPDSTKPTLSESDLVTVPVNFANFHVINRHFPRRSLTINRRPCHHHRRHELWGRDHQISYDSDIIISGEEEKPTGAERSSDAVVVADIPEIKIVVGVFPLEEDDGSKKITVKLVKHREEDEKENYKGICSRERFASFSTIWPERRKTRLRGFVLESKMLLNEVLSYLW